ncbi:MAG: hypothetical protein J6J36_05890 [Clostridia bacterium]|nr:hypothetical protein [Clostridia bacterium]
MQKHIDSLGNPEALARVLKNGRYTEEADAVTGIITIKPVCTYYEPNSKKLLSLLNVLLIESGYITKLDRKSGKIEVLPECHSVPYTMEERIQIVGEILSDMLSYGKEIAGESFGYSYMRSWVKNDGTLLIQAKNNNQLAWDHISELAELLRFIGYAVNDAGGTNILKVTNYLEVAGEKALSKSEPSNMVAEEIESVPEETDQVSEEAA